jgi:hypothetical protein
MLSNLYKTACAAACLSTHMAASSGQISVYKDYHTNPTGEIQLKKQDLFVISGEDSSKLITSSFGMRYEGSAAEEVDYSFESFNSSQRIIKYAPISFGPLQAVLPISTNDFFKIKIVNLAFTKK